MQVKDSLVIIPVIIGVIIKNLPMKKAVRIDCYVESILNRFDHFVMILDFVEMDYEKIIVVSVACVVIFIIVV